MLSCSGRHVSDKPVISQRHLKWARLHLHDSIATVRLWACRGQTVALDGGTLMFWEGWWWGRGGWGVRGRCKPWRIQILHQLSYLRREHMMNSAVRGSRFWTMLYHMDTQGNMFNYWYLVLNVYSCWNFGMMEYLSHFCSLKHQNGMFLLMYLCIIDPSHGWCWWTCTLFAIKHESLTKYCKYC